LLDERRDLAVGLLRGGPAFRHAPAEIPDDEQKSRNQRERDQRQQDVQPDHHDDHEQERQQGVGGGDESLLEERLERVSVPRGAVNEVAALGALVKAQ
jgi:hypothetical protein